MKASTKKSKHTDYMKSKTEDPAFQNNSYLDAKKLAEFIQNGAIGVIETDTIYGLVGSAFFPDVINRMYQVKRRNINKPFIVFISDIEHIKYFGVEITPDMLIGIRKYWPGPNSLILPTKENVKFEYLTRGTGGICFRMPNRDDLFELIDLCGPIANSSANVSEDPPATTIQEAYEYFGDKVDFYCDAGTVNRNPSTILKYVDGKFIEIR